MKKEYRYYDVFPRLLRAARETWITIHPRFSHVAFDPEQVYEISLSPAEGVRGQMGAAKEEHLLLKPENGDLRFPLQIEGEQEYVVFLQAADRRIAEFRLYALEEDLFARRPYKGDFHMHTCYSDGKESPAYLTAACRKIGMDFMAITDHARYYPSLEAIEAFKDAPVDLRIYPGEEVHPPNNRVHIVNFGGSFSINELFHSDQYLAEVRAIAASQEIRVEGGSLDESARYPYASCVWCFYKIREAGGLGIFCHPYWYSGRAYDVPVALTDLLFEHQPYDALELIGGYHLHEVESNTLQVARYHDERAKGKSIPVVGVSDSHGCEAGNLFGWYYTIAFSPSLDLPDLIASIKDLYSVAVEALPNEAARAYGPFRLVRYAQFLMREIFPLHDEYCLEEGRLMLAYAAGERECAADLRRLQGRVAGLYKRLWAEA